jgi:hypothetical protein
MATESSGQRRLGRPRLFLRAVEPRSVSKYLKILLKNTRKLVKFDTKHSCGNTVAVQKLKPMNTLVEL